MSFEFTKDELEGLNNLRTKVDDDRALVLPALWILQRRQGFISYKDIHISFLPFQLFLHNFQSL